MPSCVSCLLSRFLSRVFRPRFHMKESAYNVWVEHDSSAFVFNGISGALLRLPQEDYLALRRFLADGMASPCSPNVLAHLIDGLMLVPSDADEIAVLARRYETTRNDRSHFALTIVTSLGCNFDCPYCFEAKHPSIVDSPVQETLLRVLDDQLPKIKSFHVTWFGGEPLVGKKPLLALSDAFIERSDRAKVEYAAGIITNG